MNLTRGIALCALTLAIALAIGAISPLEPFARANPAPIIILQTAQPAMPTPALAALPTPALPTAPAEQLAAAPAEQLPPAAPPEIPPAALAEQLPPAAPAEISPAALAEQLPPAAPAELIPLGTLHCPCNVLENDPPPEPITDRDRAYSRARTR